MVIRRGSTPLPAGDGFQVKSSQWERIDLRCFSALAGVVIGELMIILGVDDEPIMFLCNFTGCHADGPRIVVIFDQKIKFGGLR